MISTKVSDTSWLWGLQIQPKKKGHGIFFFGLEIDEKVKLTNQSTSATFLNAHAWYLRKYFFQDFCDAGNELVRTGGSKLFCVRAAPFLEYRSNISSFLPFDPLTQ